MSCRLCWLPCTSRWRLTHGLHGRSFMGILNEESPQGWDEIYASHTFHEIQMYYPDARCQGPQVQVVSGTLHTD